MHIPYKSFFFFLSLLAEINVTFEDGMYAVLRKNMLGAWIYQGGSLVMRLDRDSLASPVLKTRGVEIELAWIYLRIIRAFATCHNRISP